MKESCEKHQFRVHQEGNTRNTWETKRHIPQIGEILAKQKERRDEIERKVDLAMYWETKLRNQRRRLY